MKPRVWVFVEQEEGQAHPVSWELLGKAQELARDLSGTVEALVLGHEVESLAREAFAYGAERVYLIDDPVLSYYRNQPYAHGVVKLCRKYQPEILLLGATTLGRDLAGSIATALETGLTADVTGLEIDPETKNLIMTRPAFGGNIMASILCPDHRPQMSTVRPRTFPLPESDPSRQGEIVREELGLSEEEVAVKRVDFIAKEKTVNLEYAEVIVSGGRGLGAPEKFEMLRELARLLGGEVGASRAVVDAGWISYEHQVGQTGKTVRPKVYIACGISGAIQHRVGMQNADFIIAINTDPQAPIFRIADLGIVGDLHQVIPALIEAVRKAKSHGQ
ncbi:electron transfer flavoprotein subunit alpha/FixB family protein [Thermosulfurimonas marina]|uniref:Electron transfer flavoprotein subunit alpha/FixB family protein n=1 Tax=Thermosulfurimonas marina TaxID=2047767 RepID=A0A6H1WQB6_9BACT|nr:electron transfer flavoprotein subunit alpha/FixB family protein [Thermosulfurimonas marina]QJA05354.1 electron transfer flavoprotein subunit alpha/FixB family protein [Thermosulfurimonas marina]